jgi:hypothetical protein
MKLLDFILTIGFVLSIFSCETEDYPEFRIAFSDGSEINQNDIQFYDSSTHLLFLKKDFELNHYASRFSVLVGNDTIYQGVKYSCLLSYPHYEPFFISDCFIYGKDIIEIGFYPFSKDLRNDPRIINSFKNNNLLRTGLSCTIDRITVKSFDSYSEVSCKITITNNDRISYYILDPGKMGESDFSYYTGGLNFKYIDTQTSSFLRWSGENPDWDNLMMNDFTVLPGKSEISYTFKSSDYHKMDKGFYYAYFSFCGPKHNTSDFELNRFNGRIWVGHALSIKDSILVE